MSRKIFGTPCVALSQLQARVRERLRQLGPLEQRPRSGEENANVAAGETLESLDALAGNFRMGLGFSKPFTGRVERDRQVIVERFEIRQPALGTRDAFGNDDEKSPRTVTAQSGGDDAVAGTFKP
jgi:hypothetical protein